MHTASVSVLKAKLSEYLDKVKKGSEISVTEHGHLIARLVPPAPGKEAEEARIERLERAGILRRPVGDGSGIKALLKRSPLKDPKGLVLKALLEEREENRNKGYR